MQINKFRTAILLTVIAFSFACKTKLDVNGPWKETMVIYGLLNPADSVQYVKINKAFLGQANAYDMAKVADSINYPVGTLSVQFEQLNSAGSAVKTISLSPDLSVSKPTGTFANVPNILYRTSEPILQNGSSYKLTVKNSTTGAEVTSTTPIIGVVQINSPSPFQKSLDWTNNMTSTRPFSVKWNSAKGGKVYQLTMRFNYKETPKTNPADTAFLYVDWDFPEQISGTTAGNEPMTQDMTGQAFYDMLKSRLAENFDVNRYAGDIQAIITMGAEEMYNYILVNTPSNNIVQDKPLYTNITGGVGIFSSRSVQKSNLLHLSTASVIELTKNSSTKNLGF